MKKRLFTVLALFLCAGTAFSQIALGSALALSPSIESRAGFLLYESDNASWFHTERFDASLAINSENPKKRRAFSIGGRYLYANSDRADLNGALRLGYADTAFESGFFKVRAGGGAFAIPDELKILSGTPRFSVADSSGLFAWTGGKADFRLFEKDWNISADFLFGKANVASGDMYYFYGRPDNFLLFGGKASVAAPFGISFFALAGGLFVDVNTSEDASVGSLSASLCAFYLAKEFELPLADGFSIKPFAGYARLRANGSGWLTSATQTYSFFPYRYVGGGFDEEAHFVSAGTSFFVKKGGFKFTLDFVYLFCFQNNYSGSYAYQYKKSIFFNGSSDTGSLDMPDVAGSHLFAGIMEASYRFKVHKHFVPTIKLTKMIAAAILSQDTLDFLDGASSSYSTVSVPPSSPAASSSGGSSTMETIKSALLSGTSVSVKIEF